MFSQIVFQHTWCPLHKSKTDNTLLKARSIITRFSNGKKVSPILRKKYSNCQKKQFLLLNYQNSNFWRKLQSMAPGSWNLPTLQATSSFLLIRKSPSTIFPSNITGLQSWLQQKLRRRGSAWWILLSLKEGSPTWTSRTPTSMAWSTSNLNIERAGSYDISLSLPKDYFPTKMKKGQTPSPLRRIRAQKYGPASTFSKRC